MQETSLKHGAFSWSELATNDTESAKTFYTKLFGWETEDIPMENGKSYTILKVDGDPVGGIMELPEDTHVTSPTWGNCITVSDVDAVAEQVESLGGKILRAPIDIKGAGRVCIFQDPQGAVISVVSYFQKSLEGLLSK